MAQRREGRKGRTGGPHPACYCPLCDGVKATFDIASDSWIAPYIDGGVYCDCTPLSPIDKLSKV